MITVKVTTPSGDTPHIKMTTGSKGIIGNYRFLVDKDTGEADWWVVVHGLPKQDETLCAKENTILITQETEFVKQFQQKYVDQFNWVITSQKPLKHPRKIYTHQGHQSYLFMRRIQPGQSLENYQNQFRTFDELRAMKVSDIPKTGLMTAVVSHKTRTVGAVARYQFITKLKEHFGSRFDIYSNQPNVFGPETKIAGFKWDAVAPYKYVIAIENSRVPHWWTNHLFDAFLAGAYPFYFGDPSIFEYFPQNSLTLIDINDIPGAIRTIEKAISENYFEKYQKEIWEARRLALDKYNLFQVIADTIDTLPSGSEKTTVTINPERDNAMELKNRLVKEIKKVPLVRSVAKTAYRTYRTLRYGQKF